jgi:hypothetical protein
MQLPQLRYTKFIITAGMLIGVFMLKWKGVDVSDLSLVLPGILAFYSASNVAQDFVNKKYGTEDVPSPPEA